jgi:hypothetical protein
LDTVRAAQSYRQHVIILQLECGTTLDALASVPLEDHALNLTRDSFAPGLRRFTIAFFRVQQHASAVESTFRPPLPISNEGLHISLGVTA